MLRAEHLGERLVEVRTTESAREQHCALAPRGPARSGKGWPGVGKRTFYHYFLTLPLCVELTIGSRRNILPKEKEHRYAGLLLGIPRGERETLRRAPAHRTGPPRGDRRRERPCTPRSHRA